MAVGCLAACSESAPEEEVLFANVADESGVVKLSEVLFSHALVPLETTEESLVGEVMKIVKENEMYYLACDWKNILMFDGDGKYRSQIDRVGPGPGEYRHVVDFDVLGERIAVLDADKVYFYTLEGRFCPDGCPAFSRDEPKAPARGKDAALHFAGGQGYRRGGQHRRGDCPLSRFYRTDRPAQTPGLYPV